VIDNLIYADDDLICIDDDLFYADNDLICIDDDLFYADDDLICVDDDLFFWLFIMANLLAAPEGETIHWVSVGNPRESIWKKEGRKG
jgi:hypothetical protein